LFVTDAPVAAVRGRWALTALGAVGVLVHGADHVVSGEGSGPLFDLALVLAVLTGGLALVYPWTARWLRDLGTAVLGLTWFVAALVNHVVVWSTEGAGPTDATGIAATLGGVSLLAATYVDLRRDDRGG
jgi:hypothetical protein